MLTNLLPQAAGLSGHNLPSGRGVASSFAAHEALAMNSYVRRQESGGPGRTRTCDQTVMSRLNHTKKPL